MDDIIWFIYWSFLNTKSVDSIAVNKPINSIIYIKRLLNMELYNTIGYNINYREEFIKKYKV